MTHDNLFQEVQEDLERQRIEDLWKRYGGWVILGAAALVLGVAGYNLWTGHTELKHQHATGDLAAIIEGVKTDDAKQIEQLQIFANLNHGQAQATLAELHAAALAAKQDDKAPAIKMYDAVAADAKADHAFRQLADLMSVELQLGSGDAAGLQTRLQPLMGAAEPWRYSAMELSGYLALRTGDKAKAKQMFTDLAEDASAPKSLSARAADMLRLLAE